MVVCGKGGDRAKPLGTLGLWVHGSCDVYGRCVEASQTTLLRIYDVRAQTVHILAATAETGTASKAHGCTQWLDTRQFCV